MGVLVSTVITDAQQELGEVDGSGVQLYSEDHILQRLRRTFDLIFKKRFWDEYFKWYTVTLAGSGGLISDNSLQYVKDFDDIKVIFRDGERQPLPRLPRTLNPYTLTGTTPLYYESLSAVSDLANITKRIKVWPLAATGTLIVGAREYPNVVGPGEPIVPATTLYLDRTLLVHGTVWQCLASEGLNSEDTQKHKELFDLRYRELIKNLAKQPIATSNPNSNIPSDWFVSP